MTMLERFEDKFFVALRHYLDSGENVLDEYSQMRWLFSGDAHIDLDADVGWSSLDDDWFC